MSKNTSSASKRLAFGTVIYMAGNLTSRLLQMLILPIITGSLKTSEYGYYDLIVTTINLIMPIVTCQIIEGMFRYMFKSDQNGKKTTVSSVVAFLVVGFAFLGVVIALIWMITPKLQYPIFIYLNYVSAIIFNFSQKIARCEQKNKVFAISGVLNTIFMLAFQAITLIPLGLGIDGMLISNFSSYLAASLYLFVSLRIWKFISFKNVERSQIRSLLHFSLPLVPNSVCWWLVDSSDRYIITYFIDASATGIYSISGKFSQLLTVITSVFQLAWQENAIIEVDSKERDAFYTKTFNTYMRLLLGGYLVVLPVIKILIPLLLAESYQVGYLYNPVLLLGAVFSAFSQFYGSAYLVFEKTSGALSTTIIASIINISIGVLFIGEIGLFAPALGTAVSFFVQWLIRAYQMREYFKVSIDYKALIVLIVSVCFITLMYYIDSIFIQIASLFVGVVVFVIMNKYILRLLFAKIIRRS